MESIIRNHIIKFMQDNKLFSNKQYGFISGRSTSLQPLTVLEEWTKALNEGLSVDCIYMDYRKTFDTVPHKRLLGKLKSYGFSDQIIGWITSFLIGRVQKVIANNQDSKWKPVRGLRDTSRIGPWTNTFCYLYQWPSGNSWITNILVRRRHKNIQSYISDINDQEILQKDLNIMNKWSDTWLLKFHADKCKHMNIRRSNKNEEHDAYRYKLNNSVLQTVDEEKDIGVTIDSQLKFDKHISEKIAKADSMAALIRRTFEHLYNETFVPLYKALVRSQLDYAHSVWAPYKAEHIEEIEKVQRRATKRLPGMSSLSYEERLKKNLNYLHYPTDDWEAI